MRPEDKEIRIYDEFDYQMQCYKNHLKKIKRQQNEDEVRDKQFV